MFRDICDGRFGLTPADLEDLTDEQLYILAVPRTELAKLGGVTRLDSTEAKALGIKSKVDLGPYGSLAQKVKAENKAKREQQAKMSKRERRREFDRQLQETRARGEKV